MTDHDALVRAVCAAPDDDTPRLVYADYLDDAGEPDRAAFVRAQVELARTSGWEPFAVLCRHRRPDWRTGDPFRHTLPELPAGFGVEWHPEPFRRGLGWRVVIRSLHGWDEVAPRLFEQAPVGEVHLRAPATLDDWRRFARGEWVRHLRAVHFESGSPVEPVRVLAATPAAAGITDLHFQVSTSPGLPILVADLLDSPLGRGLRRLSFRVGAWDWLEDLIAGLTLPDRGYDRLTLENMGLTPDLLYNWLPVNGGGRGLAELDLRTNYGIGNAGARVLADGFRRGPAAVGLRALGLSECGVADDGALAVAGCEGLAGLRRLDLGRNPLSARAAGFLAESWHLAGLRSLDLSRCRLGDKAVRRLVKATFWPNLVELDLRGNPISAVGTRYLLNAPVPPDLTALLLDAEPLGPAAAGQLRRHFGDRVVFGD